jgi:transcription termination factor Rho
VSSLLDETPEPAQGKIFVAPSVRRQQAFHGTDTPVTAQAATAQPAKHKNDRPAAKAHEKPQHQGQRQGHSPHKGQGAPGHRSPGSFQHGSRPHFGSGQHENRPPKYRDKYSYFSTPETQTNRLQLGSLPQAEALACGERIRAYALDTLDAKAPPQDLESLYTLPLPELISLAAQAELALPANSSRLQTLQALLGKASSARQPILASGVLDTLSDGSGLLVYSADSYRHTALSAYVPAALVKHYGLRKGQIVQARCLLDKVHQTTALVALEVCSIMGLAPEDNTTRIPFSELTPYYPTRRLFLETTNEARWDNCSMRVTDILCPIGLGQRGLIVAPPRTGKTVLLQSIANAISVNCPKAHLILLLVDERPEEVTDFKRHVKGEVISSTFDEKAESHVHAAEMVIEMARCRVEVGQDVIILLDSITRLARAYNALMPSSGKILSGGVEASALQMPKRFFGSARNIEGAGSLTILGTALIETGSRMDDVIFEEFKGTGNMELHLDRGLSEKRIYPAINFERTGTRKEELLYHPDEFNKVCSLRRAMKGVPGAEAIEMLIQRVRKTQSNAEFLMGLNR